MSGSPNEQNKEEKEKGNAPKNIPNSSESKIIINNSSNNSTGIDEGLIHLIDEKKIPKIKKEIEAISFTGETKISWNELKPYIIYFYEKNIKTFEENKNIPSNLNFINNRVLSFPLGNKKELKDDQIDLNNINENNILEDNNNLYFHSDIHLNNENHSEDDLIDINKKYYVYKDEKDENIEKDIVQFINKMNSMPFTIQRIAELTLDPQKYYSTQLKYNRAFYKLVNIDVD